MPTVKDDEAPVVGVLKRGDYMIHVLLEKAKDLKCPENCTVDPLIEVACLGQKCSSSSQSQVGSVGEVTWNQHLFMEPRNVEPRDAEEAKVTIKVMDKGFLRDSMIGQFEFDLSFIYFMADHVLLHKWVALSDPNGEDCNEIAGYLKLSISVAASGDEQVQITEDDSVGTDEDVMIPPQLTPKFYQIKIRVF